MQHELAHSLPSDTGCSAWPARSGHTGADTLLFACGAEHGACSLAIVWGGLAEGGSAGSLPSGSVGDPAATALPASNLPAPVGHCGSSPWERLSFGCLKAARAAQDGACKGRMSHAAGLHFHSAAAEVGVWCLPATSGHGLAHSLVLQRAAGDSKVGGLSLGVR